MAKKIGKHQTIINKFNDLNTGITPSKINRSYSSGIAVVKFYITPKEYEQLHKKHPKIVSGYNRGGFTITQIRNFVTI